MCYVYCILSDMICGWLILSSNLSNKLFLMYSYVWALSNMSIYKYLSSKNTILFLTTVYKFIIHKILIKNIVLDLFDYVFKI